MELFTPIAGLTGGAIIGGAASALLLLNGDVLGASGLMSSSFLPNTKAQQWKLVFLASFMIATQLLMLQDDETRIIPILDITNVPTVSPVGMAIGGLLVGAGTKLGNGCTSGHGICGLARLSKRSFVAVTTFMMSAIATVLTISYFNIELAQPSSEKPSFVPFLGYLLTIWIVLRAMWPVRVSGDEEQVKQQKINQSKLPGALLSGTMFAVGLGVSGMISVAKVKGFLDLSLLGTSSYDPTLMTVMGGGVLVSALSYYISGHPSLLCCGSSCLLVQAPLARRKKEENVGFDGVPTNKTIDSMLVIGAMLFGIGWGIAGMCPGPALFAAAAGSEGVIHQWLPAFFVGSFAAQAFKDRQSAAPVRVQK
jgi:uncharacterized membrane protein YedE/YeeE